MRLNDWVWPMLNYKIRFLRKLRTHSWFRRLCCLSGWFGDDVHATHSWRSKLPRLLRMKAITHQVFVNRYPVASLSSYPVSSSLQTQRCGSLSQRSICAWAMRQVDSSSYPPRRTFARDLGSMQLKSNSWRVFPPFARKLSWIGLCVLEALASWSICQCYQDTMRFRSVFGL